MTGSGFGVEPYVELNQETSQVSRGIALDIFDSLAKHYGFSYHAKSSFNWWTFHANGSIGASLGDVNMPKPYYLLNT